MVVLVGVGEGIVCVSVSLSVPTLLEGSIGMDKGTEEAGTPVRKDDGTAVP